VRTKSDPKQCTFVASINSLTEAVQILTEALLEIPLIPTKVILETLVITD
jgi:hypothetical protein